MGTQPDTLFSRATGLRPPGPGLALLAGPPAVARLLSTFPDTSVQDLRRTAILLDALWAALTSPSGGVRSAFRARLSAMRGGSSPFAVAAPVLQRLSPPRFWGLFLPLEGK